MLLSWPQGYNDIESRELSQICEKIPVFKAFKSIVIDSHLPINSNLQDETVISIAAKTHGDWPLIDITFKVIMKDGFLEEAIIHSAGSNNNLSQYVTADDWKTNYGHIAIGRLGDAMIVE